MIPQITVRVLMISYASRVVLVLFGYAISFSPSTPAQVLSPESLLEEVVSLYQGTMEASFVHQLSSELWEGSRTLTGSIQLSGDQYRIETLFEIIIGRGDEVWIYRPEDQQVLITTVEESDQAYSPAHYSILTKNFTVLKHTLVRRSVVFHISVSSYTLPMRIF